MASRIGSLDKTARLWDPATGEHRRTLTGHTNTVFGVAFSPDGRLLATAGLDDGRRGCGTDLGPQVLRIERYPYTARRCGAGPGPAGHDVGKPYRENYAA